MGILCLSSVTGDGCETLFRVDHRLSFEQNINDASGLTTSCVNNSCPSYVPGIDKVSLHLLIHLFLFFLLPLSPHSHVSSLTCSQGYAALFDGVDDYITLANTSALGLIDSSFTVFVWVKVSHHSLLSSSCSHVSLSLSHKPLSFLSYSLPRLCISLSPCIYLSLSLSSLNSMLACSTLASWEVLLRT